MTVNSFKGITVGNPFAFLSDENKTVSDFYVLQIETTIKHNRIIDCQFYYSNKENIVCKVDSQQVFFSGMFCGGSYGLELSMTLEQADSCSHQGECYEDTKYLSKNPDIKKQFEKINKGTIKKALKELGAWKDKELQDDSENEIKAIWIAACDINEEK